MEPLLGVVGAAIAISIAYLVASERRRSQLRVWRLAAQRFGLAGREEGEGGFFAGAFLRGRLGALQVGLESYRRGKYERGTKIVVRGLGHGAGGLSLRREGLSTAIEKSLVGEREIEVGDAAFDAEYFVQGRAPLALALLDPETRRRVGALLRNRIAIGTGAWVDVHASLSDGVLEVRVKENGFSGNRERVPDVLAVVLELAERLVAPADVAARLASNLRAEPEAGARLQGVLALAREFPAHPATRDALLASLGDQSEEVRLRAAMALGEDGRGTLLALAEGAALGDDCAARAVAALGDRLPGERAEAVLRRALGGAGRPQTARACLEALALLGRSEAEGLILEGLRHSDDVVAVAAAQALGKAGTAAAVPALHEAMDASGGPLRSAGRQAIAEIHARLTGAAPGQLTLAGGEAGALSLADEAGEPGRLSLAEVVEETTAIAGDEAEETEGTRKPEPKRQGQGAG